MKTRDHSADSISAKLQKGGATARSPGKGKSYGSSYYHAVSETQKLRRERTAAPRNGATECPKFSKKSRALIAWHAKNGVPSTHAPKRSLRWHPYGDRVPDREPGLGQVPGQAYPLDYIYIHIA